MATTVCAPPAQGVLPLRVQWQRMAAVLTLVAAGGLALVMSATDATLAVLWFLGMAAGFTLQRSRFCFASAFRDLFLFGSGRIMYGILVGLAVASTGFAIIMHGAVPFPTFGALPPEAHILPVGLTTVLGGLFFGFGMVLSGGCVSGSLYRMAEGYVGSWVAVGGIVIGLGLLSQTWNWWWQFVISSEPKIWLPSRLPLGYAGGLILTLAALLGAYLLLVWWEARSGVSTSDISRKEQPQDTVRQRLLAVWNAIFVRGWPPVVGGAMLGGIGVLMYMVHMPWGVTGELTRWANGSMSALGFPAPEALGLKDIGGCAARASTENGLFSHTFSVTVGLLPGALVGALFAGEFKLRFPRRTTRYVQSLGGGVLMGYGSGLAIGCTIGAFFSSIASLSVSGWLFALALGGGAFLGVQAIKRIS